MGRGVAVRGAAGATAVYWDQIADFGRNYLAAPRGRNGSPSWAKIIAATPTVGLPMFAGWREMPLADDSPARALW